jgi:protoheme IX farnesyltransferase
VNALTAVLSAATLVLYILVYTPLKSRTSLCTVIGAIPGALPPVMGWAAARGTLDPGAWALFGVLFFWQLPHFLAIAWLYREDYAKAGYPMLPVVDPEGGSTARQVVLQTLALVLISLAPVAMGWAGGAYLAGAGALGAAFLAFGLAFARERSRERARRLFLASLAYLPGLLGLMALTSQGA